MAMYEGKNRLLSAGAQMITRLASLVDRLTTGLKQLSDRLGLALDRAIYKLDKFRQQLILHFYSALRIIEKLFRVVWEIIKILVPIIVTFIPPGLGILISLFVLTGLDTIILLLFSIVLLLMLVLAYLAKDDSNAKSYRVLHAEERLKYLSDLSEYSIPLKLGGAGLGISIFVALWFISAGLSLGIVIFVAEFVVILLLPRIYKVPRPEDPQ
jgi:hypothetical protein